MITGKLSTEFADRLNKIEKELYGETTDEAIARTNSANKFSEECLALDGSSVFRNRLIGGGYIFKCKRCRLSLDLRGDGKFQPACSLSNDAMIRLALIPVEDRCNHKNKNLTVDKVYLDYCGEVQPAGI